MRLFHFSDDPGIKKFVPRPVKVPAQREPGREWLNDPLVWAIDEAHQAMYLFPRDCPRILLWPTPQTSRSDKEHWWQGSSARVLAYIEESWMGEVSKSHLFRYEFSPNQFEDLNDAGMWASKTEATPTDMQRIDDLPSQLDQFHVELRPLERLTPLKDVWQTSLHASGIRLRNAKDWPAS